MASPKKLPLLKSNQILAQTLRWQLRLWRGKVGVRLKPERRLAEVYGLNCMVIRRAFDLLEAEGILVRKHGSGTYIRKLPDKAGPITAEMKALGGHLREEDVLLLTDDDRSERLRPPLDATRLKLGFLGKPGSSNESYLTIREGIIERINRTGHKVVLLSTTELLEGGGAEKWLKTFQGERCDGLIAELKWADSLARLSNRLSVPMVYVWLGSAEATNYQPLVNMDLIGTVPRALRIFAEQGLTRLGFVDVELDVTHPIDIEVGHSLDAYKKAYVRGMTELGLDYRSYAICRIDRQSVRTELSKMFRGPDAPQAIYVGDDILMRVVAPVLAELGLQPGRNLAVITSAARGNPLPLGYNWSKMEFDAFALGQTAVDSLLREIETAGDSLVSFAHRATWRPGSTHRREGDTELCSEIEEKQWFI